ncbi:MAG: WG repeat-containing protein [Phycisphaerae bacterium]|nr:WG repeat-containing protein [Phycisphaerae bacterium]
MNKIKKKIFFLSIVFCVIFLFSCESRKVVNGKLYKIKIDGKIGYIDRDGNEVVAANYKSLDDTFALYAHSLGIDESGLTIFDNNGDSIWGLKGRYGYASCLLGGNLVFIDDGDNSCIYNYTIDKLVFNCEAIGLLNKKTDSSGFTVCKNGKWGWIDKDGNVVIDFLYDEAFHMVNNFAVVKRGSLWGGIDEKGNVKVEFIYDELSNMNNGFISAKRGDYWGVIGISGKVFLDFQFDEIRAISWPNGKFAITRKGDTFSLFDTNGVLYNEQTYDFVRECPNGYYLIRKGDVSFLLDENGNVLLENVRSAFPMKDEATMLVIDLTGWHYHANMTGEALYSNRFSKALPFCDDLAAAQANSEGLFGYIDKSGEFVIPPTYEDGNFKSFFEGFAGVKIKHGDDVQCGYIDKSGFLRIDLGLYPLKLSKGISLGKFDSGVAKIRIVNKEMYINSSGEVIWSNY